MSIDVSHLDLFRCPRLGGPSGTVMPRRSCAKRYKHANGGKRSDAQMMQTADYQPCMGCTIGRAHCNGERPVAAVQLRAKPSGKPRPRRLCMACGAQLPPGRKAHCNQACASEIKSYEHAARVLEWKARL